ncbi:DUF418 domain-containing protein [Nocardiopsis sp. CC223A]|uniref:DUF418 domain-containing protein n=1 Tax=Nocardiopsis sp. CC223A TaxID=3044051 RepID=UPI00278BAFFE|nr:DUF418 domain-containing protein [Nocardiopsis sp. CC223A]
MAAVEGVGTAAGDGRPPEASPPDPAPPEAVAPEVGRTAPRQRLPGVDTARGIALLGVFIAHMGVPLTLLLTGAPDIDAVWDEGRSGPGMLVVELVSGAVSGRSAALFAFLAGVSLVLLAGRTRPGTRVERNRVRVRVAVRALLLIAVGYGLATLGSLSVILHFYGLFFLLAIPVLWLRTRHLAVLAVAVALIGPQATLAAQEAQAGFGWFGGGSVEEEWTPEEEAEWEATWGDPEWVEEKEAYWASLEESDKDPFAEEEFAEDMPLFSLGMLESPLDLLVFGLYPATVFLAYVLAGMAAARTGLRSRRVRWWLVGGGAGLAVLGYGSSWLLLGPLARFLPGEDGYSPWRTALEAYSHGNTTFEVAGNTGVAMAVLGLCLLLAGTRPMRVVLYPVAAMGAMTLTLYTAHGVVLWAVFGGLLPGWAGWVETYTVEAVLVFSLVFATVWRLTLGAGPMERPVTAAARAVARWVVRDRAVPPREGANTVGPAA